MQVQATIVDTRNIMDRRERPEPCMILWRQIPVAGHDLRSCLKRERAISAAGLLNGCCSTDDDGGCCYSCEDPSGVPEGLVVSITVSATRPTRSE